MSILDIYREGGEEAVVEYLQEEGASSEEIESAVMFCEDYADDEDGEVD